MTAGMEEAGIPVRSRLTADDVLLAGLSLPSLRRELLDTQTRVTSVRRRATTSRGGRYAGCLFHL